MRLKMKSIFILLSLIIGLLGITASAQTRKLSRQDLPTLYSIQRTWVELNGGDTLVLLHKNRFAYPDRLYRFSSLAALLEAGVSSGEGRGKFLCEGLSKDSWCKNGIRPDPNFNCHSYSVGDVIGLTSTDWLDGVSSELTDGINPMQVVLDNYFSLVSEFDRNPESISKVARNVGLQEGDVLTLVKYSSDGSVEHVHSGRIVKEKSKNWLASKLGEGPLIIAPIAVYTMEYEGLFDAIRVYRKNSVVQDTNS